MIRRFVFSGIQYFANRAPNNGFTGEPWERVRANVNPSMFGVGSKKAFHEYFEGHSTVGITTVPEICTWLAGCEYVADNDQFARPDYWQHPVDFEKTRKGDCEDYALWAWRKLVRLGYWTCFVTGRAQFACGACDHAWVLFHDGERLSLLETVAGSASAMILEPSDVSENYQPFLAVDQTFSTFVYRQYINETPLAGSRISR